MAPEGTGTIFVLCILQKGNLQDVSFAAIRGNQDRHQAKSGFLAA